jgi:hypothetical protein
MTNPKIKIDADLDLSGASAEVDNFRKELAELKKEMSSESGKNRFETEMHAAGDALNKLMKRYDELLKKLDSLEKSGKKYANTLKEIGNLTREAAKVSSKIEDLGSLKDTGKSGYFLDESSTHNSERVRVLDQMRQDAAQARQDVNQSKWFNKAVSLASFAGGASLGGGGVGSVVGSGVGGLIGKGAGSLLSFVPGAGPVLGAFGSALGGKLGGMADEGYANAKSEAIQYSELRRAIGATKIDFEGLRDSVRKAAEGLGVYDNDAAKLADQFVRTSNASDKDDMGDSLRTSMGFARAYGIQPGASTSFFGSMRLYGSAKNDQDNRKLAAMIGESVTRSGATAKTEEMLSALQGFASNAQRALVDQNLPAYLSSLTSLVSSNSAGMKGNVGAAASLLDRANSAMMSGGAMGMASKSYMLQALNSRFPGMTAPEMEMFYEGGAFTPMSTTFGENSPLYKAAVAQGDQAAVQRYKRLAKSDVTPNDVLMDNLNRQYGNNTELKALAIKGFYGLSTTAEAAEYMERNGAVSITGKGFADFGKKLEGDDGANLLRTDAELKNQMQAAVTDFIGMEVQAKEAAITFVKSLTSIEKSLKDAFEKNNTDTAIAPDKAKPKGFGDIPKATQSMSATLGSVVSEAQSWFGDRRHQNQVSQAWRKADLNAMGFSKKQIPYAKQIIESSVQAGIDPGLALALAKKESSLNPKALGSLVSYGMHKGDRGAGIYQFMSKSSKGWNRFDVSQNIAHGVSSLAANLKKFHGRTDLAVAAHHTGAGRPEYARDELPNTSDGLSSTRDYVSDVLRDYDIFNRKLPVEGKKSIKAPQASVSVDVNLYDKDRKRAADPVRISTSFPSPVPAGL